MGLFITYRFYKRPLVCVCVRAGVRNLALCLTNKHTTLLPEDGEPAHMMCLLQYALTSQLYFERFGHNQTNLMAAVIHKNAIHIGKWQDKDCSYTQNYLSV